MATRLKNLRFNQAANLVDNPANPLAKVMLFKRADLAPTPVEQTVPPLVGDGADAVPADALTPVAKEHTMTVKDLITKMTDLFKSVEGDDEAAEQAAKDKKAKELADAEAAKCNDMAKADAVKADDVAKAAQVVELTKALTDARAAETVAKAALAEAIEKAALADMVAVLKGITHVALNADADAPIFKSLKQSNEPAFTRVMEILKGADAAVDLTKTIGSDQPGDAKSGANAWAQLEAEADKLRKDDSKITKAKAIDIVMKKFPALVKQHLEEQGA